MKHWLGGEKSLAYKQKLPGCFLLLISDNFTLEIYCVKQPTLPFNFTLTKFSCLKGHWFEEDTPADKFGGLSDPGMFIVAIKVSSIDIQS